MPAKNGEKIAILRPWLYP